MKLWIKRNHMLHIFYLYLASYSRVKIGFRSLITAIISLNPTFLNFFTSIFSNSLFFNSLKGPMQASATILRIQDAEQQSSLSTILFYSLFDRSQSTYLRYLWRSYLRDYGSGLGMRTILLKRRLAAESNSFGRLVAPITRISPLFALLIPSMRTKNSVLSLLEAQFSFSDRAVSIESISSIKIIEGAIFQAAAKILFIVFSDSPTNLFRTDEAERAKKVHPDSLAKALQIYVFPLPGGPYKSNPLGGARIPVQRSGLCLGLITASSSICLTSLNPTISLNVTSRFLTIAQAAIGSSQVSVLICCLKICFFFQGSIGRMQISYDLFAFCYLGISRILLMLLTGNPNPTFGFGFSSFSCLFFSAKALRVLYLSTFDLSCSAISGEVVFAKRSFKMQITLSQQLMAYTSLPSLMKFYAFFINSVNSVFFQACINNLMIIKTSKSMFHSIFDKLNKYIIKDTIYF